MAVWLTGYRVAALVAALLSLFIVYESYQYREKRGVTPLVLIGIGAGVWIAVKLGVSAVRGTPTVFLVTRLNLVGHGLITTGFALFAIEYTGIERPVSTRTTALLLVEPALVNLLVWVDLGYLWRPVGQDPSTLSGYAWEWATIAVAHTAFAQLLIFICGVLLVRFAIRSARIYKAQTVAILVGAGGPWVGNFLYWFGYVPFNPAPIAFAVTGLALAWAVIWAGFLNVAPIGRRAVIDDLYAAVVTLDRDHQVVEINAYARQILGYDERDSLIGRHVDELFASRSQLREVYWSMVDSADGPDCEVEFDGQYYDVDLTTLTNDRGQLVGRSLLVRDITDRKRRETELEDKNERLERFASVVSHDLRNPLNVIGGRVEIARADDEVEPHLTAIEDSTDRMEAIIEDVLTLTRRGTALEFEPINLRDVAQTAWNHVETGDATLDVTSDNTIEGDRTQVTQLFENLFRNAIEHTQEDGDGTVTVRVGSLTDGREGFFVEDDGPGIPAETRPEVLEDGYTTSAEGTGLGLTIVSDIATAHGWELTLTDSTAGGARFEIAREPAETQTGSSRNATAE